MLRYEPHRLQEEANRLATSARRAPWLWALISGYGLSSIAVAHLAQAPEVHPDHVPGAVLLVLILGVVLGALIGRALRRRRQSRAEELLWRLQVERNTRSLGELSPVESEWHRRDQLRLVRTEEADRLHADLVGHLGLKPRQARQLHGILHRRRQALEQLDDEARFIVSSAELRDRRDAIFEDSEDAMRGVFTKQQYHRFHQRDSQECAEAEDACRAPAGRGSRERLRRKLERDGGAEIRFDRGEPVIEECDEPPF